MCNSYRITPKGRAEQGVAGAVAAVAGRLASPVVRKSDPGVVVRAGGLVDLMRWGFWRSFNPSVNNTRAEKLGERMWAEAFAQRRCVIPADLFYEWGPGVAGKKQAYEFASASGGYLWMAGIWEEHPEHGPCYSMITTAAPPVMAPIHHRMPAVLGAAEVEAYLAGELRVIGPSRESLSVTACASPLRRVVDDAQGELF